MSKIGKKLIVVPATIKVKIDGGKVFLEGPKGKLDLMPHQNIKVSFDDAAKTIHVERINDERLSKSVHGLTRTLIANLVEGVLKGFEKRLRIEGIGYQAKMDKKAVELTVGFANKIKVQPPEGVTVEVPEPTVVLVKGADKQMVGQFAADVRAVRPPEPYKGKGIRYDYEIVRRKEGKAFGSGG